MRSLLTLIGAAVVTFAVVGYFLGWYRIHTAPGPEGRPQMNIDFNGTKIKEDLSKGKTKLLSVLGHHGQGAPNAPPPAPNGTTPPAPPAPGTVIVRPAAPASPVSHDGGGESWVYPGQ